MTQKKIMQEWGQPNFQDSYQNINEPQREKWIYYQRIVPVYSGSKKTYLHRIYQARRSDRTYYVELFFSDGRLVSTNPDIALINARKRER